MHLYELICIYICCIYKNISSPLYLRQIVTSIHKLSHKIWLNLNRLDRGLQRFLLAFSPFCDELKYTPDRDFFTIFLKLKNLRFLKKLKKNFFSFTENTIYILKCLYRCVVSKKYLIMHTAYIFQKL